MTANESSDDDAGGPPSSSFPQRSQTTSSAATIGKGSKRSTLEFARDDSQWLLSDGPTPVTTPRA